MLREQAAYRDAPDRRSSCTKALASQGASNHYDGTRRFLF